jgi:hypothetical protein
MSTVQERLDSTVKLRESGKHEEAHPILIELHAEFPEEPQINFPCASILNRRGSKRQAIPFYSDKSNQTC